MAKTTIKEHIINYTKNKYYFHINDLKKYFAKKGWIGVRWIGVRLHKFTKYKTETE